MVNILYVSPTDIEDNQITLSLYKFMTMHKMLDTRVKHKFIPEPVYELLNISLYENEEISKRIYPPDSILSLAADRDYLLKFEEVHHSFQDLERLVKEINVLEPGNSYLKTEDFKKHILRIRNRKDGLNKGDDVFPVLKVNSESEFSIDGSHHKNLANEYWISELLEFLQVLTSKKMAIDHKKVKLSSFLYYKNGKIAKFIHYDYLIPLPREDYALLENYKVLQKLVDEYYEELFGNSNGDGSGSHTNTDAYRVHALINSTKKNNILSFDELRTHFVEKSFPATASERIGVFVDVANIYTDLKSLQIDFEKLFLAVYGKERIKNIKDKVAFFFKPVHIVEHKAILSDRKQSEMIRELEEQGFECDKSENKLEKAKQIIDDVVRDADDYKMIQRMNERFSLLTEVLILTGDKDYVEIMEKYRDHGKVVKVISTHPDSTSNKITSSFDHAFITDYWDCIKL